MDPHQPPLDPSSSQTSPQLLTDEALEAIWHANQPNQSLQNDDPILDWNAVDEFYYRPSDPSDNAWPQLMSPTLSHMPTPEGQFEIPNLADLQVLCTLHNFATTLAAGNVDLSLPEPSLKNVTQWLNGAHRCPVPCSHCRKSRLQCLILQTTTANPNPRTACSSCVALFRECSFARGEKRPTSGFETLFPVLGHLHGVTENIEDGHHADEGLFSSSNIDKGGDRKEPKQFLRKGARILQEWFYQNQEYPYPSDTQKSQLSLETGFSEKRMSTWFSNARRRQKQKIQSSGISSKSHARSGSPMVTSTIASLTPMERWQASPPDDEHVSELPIQNAIASGATEMGASFDPFQFDGSAMNLFNFDESSSHLGSSASSFGSKASETSESASSAWSYHSSGEGGLPFPLLSKTYKPRRSRGRQRSGEDLRYQCTFCTQSFQKRHDWSRHEKSVHLSLDSWVCTLTLSEVQQSFELQSSECPFCNVRFPTAAHWEEHEFDVCSSKPVGERSFSRKDHLWQHLRKFHSCTKTPVADLEAWRGSGANIESRCGFCGCLLSTWAARAEHLADHFKKGTRMDQWEGDWGLDASAMCVLRDAVLPSQRAVGSVSVNADN